MALRNSEIGARLRELRGEKPQTTVAEELGVAERTYQNWEAGDAKPSYRNLQRLAAYFGVGEEFILTGEGERATQPAGTPDPFASQDSLADVVRAMQNVISGMQQNMQETLGAFGSVAAGMELALGAIMSQLEEQTRVLERIEAKLGQDEQTATTMQTAAAKVGGLVDGIVQRVEKGELRVAPPASKPTAAKTQPRRTRPASS